MPETIYGAPYRSDAAWYRASTGDDGYTVNVRVLGPDDTTYRARVEYDGRCGYCYLGAAHSAAYHADSVARWMASAQADNDRRVAAGLPARPLPTRYYPHGDR